MGKDSRSTTTAPMAYQLPEAEYRALIRVRDHLRLLARLTEPHCLEDGEAMPISPLALARCFQHFSDGLDDIVREAWWPGEEGASLER